MRGIGVYHVADGQFDVLTEDGGTAPLWSPDGSHIAYNVAPPNDIRIVEVQTGAIRNVTGDEWNDSVARWSADGTQLFFVSDRETDQSRDSSRTWVVSADGGDPQLLGDDPVLAFAYWPSPNGEWLAYAAPDGGGLHLSRADGSEDRPVHPTTPADMGASWSADSSGFVFSSAGEEPRTSSSCGSTRKLRSSSPMIRRMTVRRIVDRRAADPRALARVAYRIG